MSKKLDEYTKEELLQFVRDLKNRKKFGLVWEDKPEQVAIDCEVKLPVLEEFSERQINRSDNGITNLILEGDNYHSLSALNYTHANSIDVIYIDPPYNKDKEFIYNDNYVDKEDAFRHSKWLSFMSKRLMLAKDLLANHGVIFISIDDTEQAHLRLLCDQIFGYENFEGHIHWRRRSNQPNDKTKLIGLVAEHILVYAKSSKQLKEYGIGKLPLTGKFSNPDNDPRGDWNSKPWKIGSNQSGSRYAITKPNGQTVEGEWMGEKTTYETLIADKRIVFPRGGDGLPRKKIFRSEREAEGQSATNWFPYELFGSNQNATDELKALFDGICPFDNPKPTTLISRLIELGCISKNATVLDFFAGSGTTGHAVLKLNKEDNGNRKFILCTNNENNIAENITFERIKRVVEGYGDTDTYPGNVRYFRTEFVEKQKTNDQTRLALINRCTDMIRVREDAYEFLINEDKLKLLSSSNHNAAIIFDPHSIEESFKKIEDLDHTKPLNAYIFSYSSYTYDEDIPETKLQFTLCPIPESILEVYRRIFRKDSNV